MPSVVNGLDFVPDGMQATYRERIVRFRATPDQLDFLMKTYNLRYLGLRDGIFGIDPNVVIEPFSRYVGGGHQWFFPSIGAFSMSNARLASNVIVGRYCSIAPGLKRIHGSHPIDRWTTSYVSYESGGGVVFQGALADSGFTQIPNPEPANQPLVLGNDVYIGEDVRYLGDGINVGHGAIVGAGALLTKDVPPYAIVGGVPARLIRMRFTDQIIEQLLDLKWWRFNFLEFKGIEGTTPVEEFIDKIRTLEESGEIAPYLPATLTAHEFSTRFELA